MDKDRDTPPFFQVDFGEQGGKHEWDSYENVITWLNEFEQDWTWLNSGWQPGLSAWGTLSGNLSNTRSYLAQAYSQWTAGNKESSSAYISQAQQQLERFVKTYPWVLSQSPKRAFLFKLKDDGKTSEAGVIAAFWMQLGVEGAPLGSAVWALLQAELFDRGTQNRMDLEESALSQLRSSYQTHLTWLKGNGEKQEKIFNSDQDQRSRSWNEQVEKAKGELKNIQDTYDGYMSLAAPVMYWEAKQKKHRRFTIGSGLILVVAMALSAWFLHTEILSIGKVATTQQSVVKATQKAQETDSSSASSNTTTPQSQSQTAKLEANALEPLSRAIEVSAVWKLGSFILLATLLFWFIRILVRVFLSNMHLENDAAERVTMAKTYLALLRKGRLPEQADISVVLAALFRPSGDGIVKDEGVPPTTLEWFTKLGK